MQPRRHEGRGRLRDAASTDSCAVPDVIDAAVMPATVVCRGCVSRVRQ